jgi:hypothetical protein
MNWKESFLRQEGTNAAGNVTAVNAVLGYAEDVVASQPGMGPQDLSTAMSKKTRVGSKRFGWGPHPHRHQVHIQLAKSRPRAVTPPLCEGASSFLAAVTISIGFGSAMGVAREGWMVSDDLLVEPTRDGFRGWFLVGMGG